MRFRRIQPDDAGVSLSGSTVGWLVPKWPAPPNVRAVTTTRDGTEASRRSPFGFNIGIHCGDDPDAVRANRAFLREALSLPSEPRWLRQVHGTRVIEFGGTAAGEPEADAAVTGTPGVVLAIQTADCLPVLFAAGDGSEVAAAHAGWRGLSAGVLESTLDAMRTRRAGVIAWLGPAIAAKSYEVGEEVRDAFLAGDPRSADAFTVSRSGHWHCDLHELACQRLRANGVTRIFGGGCDTFADPRFHSYRRDRARSGRMATLAWLAR